MFVTFEAFPNTMLLKIFSLSIVNVFRLRQIFLAPLAYRYRRSERDASKRIRRLCIHGLLVFVCVCGCICDGKNCCRREQMCFTAQQSGIGASEQPASLASNQTISKWNTFKTVYHQNSFDSHCHKHTSSKSIHHADTTLVNAFRKLQKKKKTNIERERIKRI